MARISNINNIKGDLNKGFNSDEPSRLISPTSKKHFKKNDGDSDIEIQHEDFEITDRHLHMASNMKFLWSINEIKTRCDIEKKAYPKDKYAVISNLEDFRLIRSKED